MPSNFANHSAARHVGPNGAPVAEQRQQKSAAERAERRAQPLLRRRRSLGSLELDNLSVMQSSELALALSELRRLKGSMGSSGTGGGSGSSGMDSSIAKLQLEFSSRLGPAPAPMLSAGSSSFPLRSVFGATLSPLHAIGEAGEEAEGADSGAAVPSPAVGAEMTPAPLTRPQAQRSLAEDGSGASSTAGVASGAGGSDDDGSHDGNDGHDHDVSSSSPPPVRQRLRRSSDPLPSRGTAAAAAVAAAPFRPQEQQQHEEQE